MLTCELTRCLLLFEHDIASANYRNGAHQKRVKDMRTPKEKRQGLAISIVISILTIHLMSISVLQGRSHLTPNM